MCKKLISSVSFVAVLSLVLTSVGNAADPEDYLVLHLPFDEGSGAVTEDTSAAGLPVTLEGEYQWTTGMFGQAVAFTNGWAEVSGDYPLNLPQITVMAWINPTSIVPEVAANHWTNANNIYGKKGNNGDDSIGLGLTGGNGVLFYADTVSDNMLFVLDAGVQTGQWQHIAATFDGTIMRVFLDGEQIGEMAASGSGSIIEIFHPVRVGGNPDQNIDFDGAIDEVKVFDQALTTDEIQRAMKGGPAGLASEPDPADKAADVPRDVVLSWTPGEFADLHDVYFGTSFDDVNNATATVDLTGVYRGRLSDSSYAVPERLDLGETYYWRVDEVNAPPDSTVFKGDVWSFTTEPVGYPVDGANITATASSSMAGSAPEKTIDGSGLDDSDLHSTSPEDMWLSDMLGSQPTWIEYQFDKVYKLHEMSVWNQNQIIEPSIGYGFKDVSIEYSADGIAYTTLGTTHEFARGPGAAGYAANTNVDFGGAAAKYVKLTVNSGWESILTQYGLSEVRFLYLPIWAREPSPDSGATDADVNAFLSFRAGREAAKHDLYLSTDDQAVIDGTVLVATVTEASYAPSLDLAGTYYWRIDEVNDTESPTTWQGDIWNFSTQEYLIVDDFESYNDIPVEQEGSNLIHMTWIDGFENPSANGSTIGYVEPFQPTMETSILYDGKQSVLLSYDNTVATYSEVTANVADLQAGQDWAKHGIKALTLRFYGDPNNVVQQMYVKLNGTKVAYDGSAENTRLAGWQMWYIDLASISVSLSNVTELSIGFERIGAVGGQGMVLLDGIRLYSYDRQFITPVDPGTTGLQAHYEFEGTANDSSDNARNGTLMGNPTFVAGNVGQAISLDGLGDYVNIDGYKGILGSSAVTVTAWIKTIGTDTGAIVGWGPDVAGERFGFRVDAGRLRAEHAGGNVQGDTLVNDGGWYHVAVTVQENVTISYPDVILYLNGTDDTRPTIDTDPVFNITAAEDVSIGRRPASNDRLFIGQIDDVRIYDRALTQEEVTWLAGRIEPFDKPF
jgi:hypothetical protein